MYCLKLAEIPTKRPARALLQAGIVSSRSKVALGSLLFLVVVACGRTADDNDGGAGGPAGSSAGSGVAATGGKLGVGGGSTTAGGSSGEGNAANMGGSTISEAGAAGSAGDPVPLGEGSWETTLAFTVTVVEPIPNANVSCTATNFTLHFSPSGSGLKVILGRDGAVQPGELTRSTPGSPRYSVAQALPVPTGAGCNLRSIEITELTLQAWDESGDGNADSISGSGKARGIFIVGDAGLSVELSYTLQGVPDETKPSLLALSNIHPLDGVFLRATEPVALISRVTLTDTDSGHTSHPLGGNAESNGAFGTFSSNLILPFGSTWKLSATGGDLADLPFEIAALPPIVVLADPGLFAQDGFESTPALSRTGDAQIVTSVGSLPAIQGSQSLLVPPGSSATLHLARPSGASSVRFTAQSLTSMSGPAFFAAADLEAGVIGGSERVGLTEALPTTPSTTTNDSAWRYAGPTQEISLPLTESGADVVIRFAPPACQGLCPPARALLIDELRVE